MTKTEIGKLLSELEIPFAIVANVNTGEMEKFGDPASIKAAGLINTLFHDASAVAILSSSIEEHLYDTWNQGDAVCIVCRPVKDIVIGLFGKKLGPVEQYQWTKQLCESVNSLWK